MNSAHATPLARDVCTSHLSCDIEVAGLVLREDREKLSYAGVEIFSHFFLVCGQTIVTGGEAKASTNLCIATYTTVNPQQFLNLCGTMVTV